MSDEPGVTVLSAGEYYIEAQILEGLLVSMIEVSPHSVLFTT